MARPAPRPARVNETHSAATRKNQQRAMPHSRHVGKLYVDPAEIPAGVAYSWIAVEQLQVPDFARADEQAAKGWTPVPRDRHARFRIAFGSLIPGRAETDPYAPFVKVGGLLLCERPRDEVEDDRLQQQISTNDQMRSVSRWRSGEGTDPMVPRFDQSSDPEHSYGESFKKD